jgi:hypothetical protein
LTVKPGHATLPQNRGGFDMRYLAAVIMAVALAMPVIADAKPNCAKGKPCGNSCIAKDKVCHKP